MNINEIDKSEIPMKDYSLETAFRFDEQDYKFGITGGEEFGMSNYFWDIEISKNNLIIKDCSVRSFLINQSISNNGRYIFLPKHKEMELFDLEKRESVYFKYHRDLGIFTDYYLNQFSKDDSYLIVAFENGFEVFDLEKGNQSIFENFPEKNKLIDVHIGEDNLIWKNIVRSGKQIIKRTDERGREHGFLELIEPSEFYSFDIGKYEQYMAKEKCLIHIQESNSYTSSNRLNKWFNVNGFENIYMTYVPISIPANKKGKLDCCADVIEKYVKMKE